MKYVYQFWPLYAVTVVLFLLLALGTEWVVTTVAENSPLQREHIIIIDAGHGGVDGGATSCNGVLESHINLSIARKLEDLCHLLGYATVMIRRDDVSVYTEGTTIAAKKASDLRNRVRIVNEKENSILISIHQNTFADSRYSGAQVFYAATEGSQGLAQNIQELFKTTINKGSTRQCKPAEHVYVMRNIQRTGVLIECGFLSNPEEERNLVSSQYQNQICAVIIAGISEYLNP